MAGNELVLMTELAKGAGISEAARTAHMSLRTAQRRAADPGVQQQVAALRSDAVAQAGARLSAACCEAVDTLRGLLRAENDNVKVRAALGILTQVVNMRAHVEFGERLDSAEKVLERISDGNRTSIGPA